MSRNGFKITVLRLAKTAIVLAVVAIAGETQAAGQGSSALSAEPAPLKTEKELPTRTPPIIEIGPHFLGRGNIDPGIELPTGAVWQPALWVFGDHRTAFQYFDSGDAAETQEIVTRLDLLFNLQLSPTERILFGISPLRRGSSFSGYRRQPDEQRGFFSDFNLDTTTLFFEGEFGEIFPNLDPDDRGSLDFGFSVGRQPVFFQEGIMINDTLDSVGLTRDTIVIPGISPDMRVTALFAWNNVHRDDNRESGKTYLLGLFSEIDLRRTTAQFDMAYVLGDEGAVNGSGDGFNWGAAAIQRFGKINTAFRVNQSFAIDQETDAVSNGTVFFAETSLTPAYSDDVIYANAFWGIDNFSSAARSETAGGPLGRAGILFASVGLGDYGFGLSNRADDVIGGALGYQMFFNNQRTQLVLEIGGRADTSGNDNNALAVGARFQQAIGKRVVFQVDGFVAKNSNANDGSGLRTEILVRF